MTDIQSSPSVEPAPLVELVETRRAAAVVSTSSTSGEAPVQVPAVAPLLTVTKGNPTAEELAALTAVVLSIQSEPVAEPVLPGARQWVRRAQLNMTPKPGPGAWRRARG